MPTKVNRGRPRHPSLRNTLKQNRCDKRSEIGCANRIGRCIWTRKTKKKGSYCRRKKNDLI